MTPFCQRLLHSIAISSLFFSRCVIGAPHPIALPRSTPEAQGVSSAGVLAFVEAADRIDAMHSFMLVRHGRVIAEGWWAPYNAESNHELYSLSKSFTSTAVGLAVAEKKLSLDDQVLQYFPQDAPSNPSANLKSMRVRDLLMMSTGHQDEPPTAWDKVSPQSFLSQAVPHKPGTHFKYNTAATFMLSAIVQKQTGQTVLEYLRPRLFEPLGIEHPIWNTNSQGISLGGYGLKIRTEDIAKFGQFYLQRGKWNGRQILSESWVQMATSRQTSNGSNPNSDWDQGYGFQFWRCRNGAYRGDGAFGQYCLVMPEQDAVLAITSGVRDMQAVLNVVWDKLLPAMQPRKLTADSASNTKLKAKLGTLSLPTVSGKAWSALGSTLSGKKFKFLENPQKLEWMNFAPNVAGTAVFVTSRINGIETRIRCGFGEWYRSRGPFGSYLDEPLAASGAWVDESTYVAKICATDTPYYTTLKFHFDGNSSVTREYENNVGFNATKQPPLTGKTE